MIVMKDKDVKPDGDLDDEPPLDLIYGNALFRTWNWLWEGADVENPPEALEGGEKTGKRLKGKAKAPVGVAHHRLRHQRLRCIVRESRRRRPHSHSRQSARAVRVVARHGHAPGPHQLSWQLRCTRPRPGRGAVHPRTATRRPDVQVC